MLDTATYNGRPLESFHDRQLRFRYVYAPDGLVTVLADSPSAEATLASLEYGPRARKLAAGIAHASTAASGQPLKGSVFSMTSDAHAAAILQARLLDPAWRERTKDLTPAELEATVDAHAHSKGAARNGWMMLDPDAAKPWRNFAQGASSDHVALDDLPHLVAHESLHFDPNTQILLDALPIEEGFVDFRARDPRLLRSTADLMELQHVDRPIVVDNYRGHVAAFERMLDLAGHDVATPAGIEGLRDAMQGARLDAIIEDSITRIAAAAGTTPTEAVADDARYLIARASSASAMDAAIAGLRALR